MSTPDQVIKKRGHTEAVGMRPLLPAAVAEQLCASVSVCCAPPQLLATVGRGPLDDQELLIRLSD